MNDEEIQWFEKPPIGVKPKAIHDAERVNNLKGGIRRYLEADKAVPVEWVTEYNDLVVGSVVNDVG